MALAKTNESTARSADKHRHDVWFHSSDLVYINTAHFSLAPGLSRKLAPKWVGPFPIEQVISTVAYCISLPKEYGHIYPVFLYFLLTWTPWVSTFMSTSYLPSS